MPERIERLRDPETRAADARAVAVAGGRRVPPPRRLGRLPCSATSTPPENEGLQGRIVGDIAAERGTVDVRHAARHRDRRRPAHGPVADPAGRRRRVVGAAPRGVGRPAGDDRRLRRRRAPRPHVRRALHHPVPRRLPPRPPAGVARAGGAADHRARRPRCSACATAACSREGAIADVVVFDPDDRRRRATPRSCADLPGDSARLTAGSQGIVRVLVNGVADRRRRRGHRRHAGRRAALRPRHRDRHRPVATWHGAGDDVPSSHDLTDVSEVP